MKSGLQIEESNYTDKREIFTSPPADLSRLFKSIGYDKELLKDLINMLIDTYPEKLEKLKRAVSDKNVKEFERIAHSFKGSIGNFGAKQAFDLAYKLENMGRKSQLDGADEIINELQKEMERLKGFLRSMSELNLTKND